MKTGLRFASSLFGFLLASPVFAHVETNVGTHVGTGEASAFMAGLYHPFGGWDHLLAIVAIGLWAVFCAKPALWLWPLTFLGAVLAGGVLGISGVDLPYFEQGILASVMAMGIALAFALRLPAILSAGLIAVTGVLHGFAHGAEAPLTGGGFLYALGFALATAALLFLAMAVAQKVQKASKPILIRAFGGFMILFGAASIFAGG